ncbi:non-ribosomal peptide synthetase [Pseudoalteromonas prydzensis]|uniref:Amino acid adenylation domain-containing protein n=1 Tax=Pseudoalteromonas prydzensis TaxID=182141 RepID=A0ABR9FJP3_9GAMM|nr:non-ribosomal peptide synthetase [Pseudoalteromonas prydzensis]MBE0457053.1 amino acid adenylation domain-containing protein [Pseudoalteromonas prydzensis]
MSQQVIQRIAERFHQLPDDKRQLVYNKVQSDGMHMRQFPILPLYQNDEALLSYAQQRQWFLWHLNPDSAAYHITGGLQLTGELNSAALNRAFQLLVARHPALRTQFKQRGEQVYQQPLAATKALDFQVLQGHGEQVEALRHELVNKPFDLLTGMLIRVGLFSIAPEKYQLVIVLHHIIADGSSLKLLLSEFVLLYSKLLENHPLNGVSEVTAEQLNSLELPLLPIQYSDFAKWQRDWLAAGELQHQLAFWQTRLGDIHPVLQLQSDNGLGAADTKVNQCAYERWQLPLQLTEQLQQFTQQYHVSYFMVLLTAFEILLHRYSGQEHIRVGTPIANRQRPETANVVGLFVNTQVQDNHFTSRTSAYQVLQQVKEAILDSQEYQDLPFEQLVEALQPQRSVDIHPLFQVMFNHQYGDINQLHQLPNLTVSELPATTEQLQFELVLDAQQTTTGECFLCLSYSLAHLPAEQAKRMREHFNNIVHAMLAQPDIAVGDITLLSDDEVRQWQAWAVNRQVEDTTPVHEKFSRLAVMQPNVAAAVFANERLNYRQLEEKSNQVAHYLQSLEIGCEDRVGVAIQRSMDTVVVLMGILKAGAAFVPLDQDHPAERLAFIVDNSELKAIITHPATLLKVDSLLHGYGDTPSARQACAERIARLPLINLQQLAWHTLPSTALDIKVHPEQLAYMIYTSGSTGHPKGASITHQALSNCLAWMTRQYQPTRQDVVLHKAAFGFDVSCWEIFFPLSSGAQVVIAEPGDQRDPTQLLALIEQHQITISSFAPALLQLFLDQLAGECCASLRHIMCGGEAVPAELFRNTHTVLPYARLNNLYGPTETTIHVTHWPGINDSRTLAPIGTGVSHTHSYILDASLNPVPIGVVGELYIAGIQLARGYFARPDLSAERFVADSILGNGGRMYRTGDLARCNHNAEIEYLGRCDDQVQIRGFRIELGEIEEQLRRIPLVREAKVLVKHNAGGEHIVAYITGNIETTELALKLAEHLPDYMIPSVFVSLDKLPLTANGKIDHKALPEPEWIAAKKYQAPRGAAEVVVARLWSVLLGIEQISRDDNFFSLGGHSLLAIKLMERLRQTGWQAKVKTLFSLPVLKDFAAALEQQESAVQPEFDWLGIAVDCKHITSDMLPLVSLTDEQIDTITQQVVGAVANVQDIYPLTALQSGILFHHLLQERGDTYITPNLLRFANKRLLVDFVAALNQVIARHDILRTCVFWQGLAEPVQVVQRHAEVQLQWLVGDTNFSLDTDTQGLTATARFLNDSVSTTNLRFNIQQAPLLAAIGIQEAKSDTCWLQLPSHHLIMDHTSLEILVQEVHCILVGESERLQPAVPFRRFVALALQQQEDKQQQRAFFSQLLADIDTPTAPYSVLDVQGTGEDIENSHIAVPDELAAQIRSLAVAENVSAAAVFHLAWAMVLQKLTGLNDPVFGTVLFGRAQGGLGVDRAVGMFINTLPIRFRLHQADVRNGLQQAHQVLTNLLAYENASLPEAQACSGITKGTPLFSSLLNYRYSAAADKSQSANTEDLKQQGFLHSFGGQERTNYPIGISIDDFSCGFNLTSQTVTSISSAPLCDYLLKALRYLVQQGQSNKQHICDWSILSPKAWQQQRNWGENSDVYNTDIPVCRQFENQVTKHADNIAMTFQGRHYSFFELNEQANRLAHYLQAQGIGAESRVAVGMWRSAEMVISLLAIMKVGAMYVPLDLEYPVARLAYIISSSRVQLLLCHQPGLTVLNEISTDVPVLIWERIPLSEFAPSNLLQHIHPEQLAYVIYTSGSTGRPKGVAISHRALANCMAWMQAEYQMTRTDAVLHKAPFGFDVSCWEIFWPLSQGGRLVISSPGDHRDPERLITLIAQQQVTIVSFVPAMQQAFIDQVDPQQGCSLRNIMVGGEAVPTELRQRTFAVLPDVKIHNLYGPTEATIHATHWQCNNDQRVTLPIGRGISSTACYVLDEYMHPVPEGIAGELYLAGVGLSRGYLERPDLTAERFVANPFDKSGGRIYRTGDLVRWNHEGLLEYIGRLDDQIKIRGLRIELGEIEAQLASLTYIQKAIVLACKTPLGERLVGYVQSARADLQPEELKALLAKRLPAYMVPSIIVLLKTLPLSPNGKIDSKALPVPKWYDENDYVAPHTELEISLATVWSQVLGEAKVGRLSNFFELGGDSIACMKVVAMLRQQGHNIAVKDMFAVTNLKQLAELMNKQDTYVDTLDDGPIVRLNTELPQATPLFCIHDGFGKVWDYSTLARHLDGQRSVYGLTFQPSALLNERCDFAVLVKQHIEQIRKVQKTGPYRLCGWSLGGVLAHWVAAELQQQGESVEQLLLLDPYSPTKVSGDLTDSANPISQIQTFFSLLLTQQSSAILLQDALIKRAIKEFIGLPVVSDKHIRDLMTVVLLHAATEFKAGYVHLTEHQLYQLYLGFQSLFLSALSLQKLPFFAGHIELFWMQHRVDSDKMWWRAWFNCHNVAERELNVGHFDVVKALQVLEIV